MISLLALPDPRLITAVAYAIVGLAAVALSLRVWWTHPINRVFSLGPFVTEEGLKFILRNIRMVFALGVFSLASAASRLSYWIAGVADPKSVPANFFGLIETIFAAWAAGCVVVAAWRLCRKG